MNPVIIDLGRDYRGGQHQALLLLQGLRARGHAPALIAVSDSVLADRAETAGIPVHRADAGRRRLAASSLVRHLLREGHVDVVHANEPHALSASWLARAHRSVPVVVSRRVVYPLSSSFISLARYRAAARIVAVSNCVKQSVIQSGLSAGQIEVIYDGVTIPPPISAVDSRDARQRLGIPTDCFCIGNIAAYVPGKGHEILIRAFAELLKQQPKCILILRGEGPGLTSIQEIVRELQISNFVKFIAPAAEIEFMFRAMDLFVFPVSAEALGSILLAAMAHGLPVVASASGGIPEVVEHEKNGLLLESVDVATLAAAMNRLIFNSVEARMLGTAARKTVSDRFSADRMVDATVRLYEELRSTFA